MMNDKLKNECGTYARTDDDVERPREFLQRRDLSMKQIWNLLLNKKKNELQYSTHLFINSMLNDFGYLFICFTYRLLLMDDMI